MDDVLEPVATPDATGTTVPVTDTATPDETHPDSLATPVVPEEEAMWGDLKEDEPVAVPDPNAAISPELTKVFESSSYVKSMEHISPAVQTAGEVWDVSTGKAKASNLLEQLQSANPAIFEAQLKDNLVQFMIPHIERITGQKFGAPPADDPDRPMTRAEYEQAQRNAQHQAQVERETREQELQRTQHIAQAAAVTDRHLADFIKAGNGAFEGDPQGAIDAMAAQLPKLGITADQLMAEVLSGKTANLEKAYKAAEKAETLKAKAYSDRIRAKFKTLKAAVPASKGASAGATNPADGAPDLTTASGRAKAMADAFKAGRDTI